MIKLRYISRNDNKIVCNDFVEDCGTPIKLVLDIKSKELAGYELPCDYEWCKTHVMYAKSRTSFQGCLRKAKICNEKGESCVDFNTI